MQTAQILNRINDLFSVVPGYAVTAGHFSSTNAIDVAAGAPQHNNVGEV